MLKKINKKKLLDSDIELSRFDGFKLNAPVCPLVAGAFQAFVRPPCKESSE